jgi:hypothetical protein
MTTNVYPIINTTKKSTPISLSISRFTMVVGLRGWYYELILIF